ncbi:MAG: MurR/RpiR family transcriptional regulator [Mycoplasmatales bacterium]|nr:MurR/RpiR family transcriptional regulator [Mycoplasmatales bacterium]
MLKDRMSIKKEDFTSTDLKIYKFINNENNSKHFMKSITQISEVIGVSSSAITRFCQKVQYSGWKELQGKIKYEMKERTSKYDGVSKELHQMIYSLSRTDKSINKKAISIIANKILEADFIFIYGEAFTKIQAHAFRLKLNKININAQDFEVAGETGFILPKKNSIHIFISMSGMNPNVKRAVNKLTTIKMANQSIYTVGATPNSNVSNLINEHIGGEFIQANSQDPYELPSTAGYVTQYILDRIFDEVYDNNSESNKKLIQKFAKVKSR